MHRRSRKLIIVTPLALVAAAAIVAGTASAASTVPGDTQQQPPPSAPSDSAAYPGGGTVSVQGVSYSKGNVAPVFSSPQSGPSAEQTQTAAVEPASGDVGTTLSSPARQRALSASGLPMNHTQNAAVDSPSSGGGAINASHSRQQVSSAPSDSAAFPGGGTVSVQGVNYPKGNVAPAVGTSQSGPVVRHVSVLYAAPSSSGGGFDWGDAGVGLAIGIGVASVIALSFVGIRRSRATPAPA
jgi:hypothetical protein